MLRRRLWNMVKDITFIICWTNEWCSNSISYRHIRKNYREATACSDILYFLNQERKQIAFHMGPVLIVSILWNNYKIPFQEIKSLWAIKMNNIRWNDNLEIKFKEFELCLVKGEVFIEVIVATHIIGWYQNYTMFYLWMLYHFSRCPWDFSNNWIKFSTDIDYSECCA